MKLPNRKSEIKRDVQHRQSMKNKWDKRCKYSSDEELQQSIASGQIQEFEATRKFQAGGDNWTRLLDEGVVVDGGDWIFGVIKKGVIKRFYDELPDNFEGYIDKDHFKPIYLGKYTKKDLKLVELDDDRYALDVNIKLDRSLYAVQDLLKQNEHRALSVEMQIKADEYARASKVTGMSAEEVESKFGWDYLVPLIEDIGIMGFAICENPKNANSYNDDLLENASVKEDNMHKNEDATKNLAAEEEAKTNVAEEQTEQADDQVQGDADANADGDKADENATDNSADGTNEETEEDADGANEGEKPDQLEELSAAIANLNETIQAKDAKIAELEAQLEAKKTAEMSTEDRIAQLLNVATLSKSSKAEGMSTKNEDSVADIYRQAFAEE